MRAASRRRATAHVLLKVATAALLVVFVGGRALAAGGGDDEEKSPDPAPSRGITNMKVANFDEALSAALARRGAAARVTCDR